VATSVPSLKSVNWSVPDL